MQEFLVNGLNLGEKSRVGDEDPPENPEQLHRLEQDDNPEKPCPKQDDENQEQKQHSRNQMKMRGTTRNTMKSRNNTSRNKKKTHNNAITRKTRNAA